jgi:DNA gyrase subunit B
LKDFQDRMTSEHQNQQEKFTVVDAREHVRRRPGMYFSGGTDSNAMHQLAMIVLENSVNRALLAQCTQIAVTIEDGTRITIEDNGPGIPTNLHADTGKTVLELVLKKSGMRRPSYDEENDVFARGMIGNIGIGAVNCVSAQFEAEVKRDGKVWFQQFAHGLPTSELTVTRAMELEEETGTRVTFTPDFELFEQNDFDPAYFAYRLSEYAYLLPLTTFTLREIRGGQVVSETVYKSEQGIADYLEVLNRGKEVLHEPLEIHVGEDAENLSLRLEVALQYVEEPDFILLSYVNATPVPLTHSYITAVLDKLYISLLGGYFSYSHDQFEFADIMGGLTAIINIVDPQAIFGYQDIARDYQDEIQDMISKIIFDATYPVSDELRLISQAVRAKCEANRKRNSARKMGQ